MLFTLSILFPLLFNSIFAIEITQNRVDQGTINTKIGDITIDSGAYWSIIDNSISSFIGDLNIKTNAGLYISLTILDLPLLVLLNSGSASITNNGIISLDSRSSTQGSSQYNLVGESFLNNGEFYLAASGVIPMTMGLTGKSWNNNGLIVAYQNQRKSGSVRFGVIGQTIINKGQICLINQVLQQTSKIDGSGCITTKENSSIYISNVLDPQSVSSEQNYYLADDKSSIIVEAVGFNSQSFNVFGFGNGNKIGLTLSLKFGAGSGNSGLAYSYDSNTGILSLTSGLFGQKFNIGPGYNSSLFSIVTDDSDGIPSVDNGAVTYSGPVPNQKSLPSACNVECKQIPDVPDNGPSSSSSSSSGVITTTTSTSTDTTIDTASVSSTSNEESSASESPNNSASNELSTTFEVSQTIGTSEPSASESSEIDISGTTDPDTATSSGNDNSNSLSTFSSNTNSDTISSETGSVSSYSTPSSGDSSEVSSLATGTLPDTITGSQESSTSGFTSGVIESSGVSDNSNSVATTATTPNSVDVNTQSNTDNTVTSAITTDTGVNTPITTGTGSGSDNNGVLPTDSNVNSNETDNISTLTTSSTTLISVVSSSQPIAEESTLPSSFASGIPGEVIPNANGSSKLSINLSFIISGCAIILGLFM